MVYFHGLDFTKSGLGVHVATQGFFVPVDHDEMVVRFVAYERQATCEEDVHGAAAWFGFTMHKEHDVVEAFFAVVVCSSP